jgi:adenylate cyclase
MDTTEDRQFRDLTVRLKESLGADRCTFYILDREQNEVWSKVALGLEAGEIRLPIRRGVVGYVARSGKSLNLRDVYNDPRFDRSVDQRTGYRTRSVLAMAIRNAANQVVGVLQAINKAEGTFTPEDEAAMEGYCREAAALIERGPAEA